MKIGIISDVHDNLRTLSLVLKKLKDEEKVDMLINCGDWDMPFTMRTYVGFDKPIRGVLGNGDPDIQKFEYQLQNLEMLKGIDMQINFRFFDLSYDGKRIAVFHGDDDSLNKVLIESQLFDVLCVGHNHIPLLTKQGKTMIINSGSLVGFLAEKGNVPITYAIYDTISGLAEIKDFEKNSALFSSMS
jgi:putative phosphoesterase